MGIRLGVVVDGFPRWSERFIARELRELARRGVELSIFSLATGRLPPGADEEWDGLLERAERLPAWSSVSTLGAALAAIPTLRSAQARRQLLELRKAMGSRGIAGGARAHVLARRLHAAGCTHVHAHFANWPSTLAWIAARELGLPWSCSLHARDLYVEAQLLPEKLRDAQAVFACHRAAMDWLGKTPGARPETLRLMAHGLPLERFPFQARSPGKEPPRLLAAGRFVAKKGWSDLLEAFEQPALRRKEFTLVLVGDGPERGAIRRRIAELGLRDRVELRPPQAGPRLRRLFAGAALLVAPYRTAQDGDQDGMPNIVLEAFASGLPVVGTDAGGLPDALTAQTGWVTPAGAPRKLAQALLQALEDPGQAAARARAARALVEECYDIRRAIEPLYALLEGGPVRGMGTRADLSGTSTSRNRPPERD